MTLRPKAELVTVGTELVTGSVVNTNAAYLGRELTKLGFEVQWQSACRDEKGAIQEALRRGLGRSKVIFVTGGLGPTPDDITRESLAELFRVPLVLSKAQYRMILGYYRRRGEVLPSLVKREACFPANAKPVFNRFGIALGFMIEEEGRIVIVVPGVPAELTRLFESRLKPFLKRKFHWLRPAHLLLVRTVGLSEPSVMKRLGQAFFKMGKFEFGIYPEAGEVSFRIYADSEPLIRRLKQRVIQVMKRDVYSFTEDPLAAVIGKELRAQRMTLSVAESCTGGKLADRIVSVSGASRYFRGGMVTYQNDTKSALLGISPHSIESKGAVSRETALAMARAIRERFGSILGVAITGIAGPTGGNVRKPVGLVYIAIASQDRVKAWEERFPGDREQIQIRSAKKALEYLWRWLQNQKSVRS